MKSLHNYKFKTQILVYYMLLIVFILAAVMWLLYYILQNSYREMARSVLETQAKQIAMNIDNKIEYYTSYSEMLLSNSNLVYAAENRDFHTVEQVLGLESARFIALNKGKINKIQIYRNGIYTRSTGDIQRMLQNTQASSNNIYWTGTYLNDRNEKVFSLFRRLYLRNPDRVYLLEICLYETELFSLFTKENRNNGIMVLNRGELLSTSDRKTFVSDLYGVREAYAGVPASTVETEKNTYRISAKCSVGWDVVITVNNDYLDQNFKKLYVGIVPFVLAVLAFGSAMATLLSNQINRRFSILHRKIDLIGQWDLTQDLRIGGSDEISELSASLENTKQRIIGLISQIHDINELKRAAEISALRAQINSHFLFNTLSSIKWLSKSGNQSAVAEAVDKLAFFLRYSLSLNENQVPLRDEIEQLNAYIYFQKQRYGSEINVNIDIDNEVLSCKTVKLILQPLVENAIYHGKKENGSMLNITIYTTYDKQYYYLIVEDDGNGIPEEKIADILRERGEGAGENIGLRNVINRVRMCSDGQGDLGIESRANTFTKITIKQKRCSDGAGLPAGGRSE